MIMLYSPLVVTSLPVDGFSSSSPSEAGWRDYFALLKPRVMGLVVFTALVGLVLAPQPINPFIGFLAILCIAVGGGASGALNMWYEADIDALMNRTKTRPIPAGLIERNSVLIFALSLASFSILIMGIFVNWFASGFLAFTIFFYAVIYTMWLKPTTPQNIVIGGAAGAFPPMIGWAAATGSISMTSIVLFLIIFMWTPPHFWALAIFRREDYARALVPMLPVTHGVHYTRWQILLYTVLLCVVTVLPTLIGMSGLFYLGGALVLGSVFLWYAWRLLNPPDEFFAMRMFHYSVVYLMALFGFLLADHWLAL